MSAPRMLDLTSHRDAMVVEVARNASPVFKHYAADYSALIYPLHDEDNPQGAPEGYVVWWTDDVVNQWAEFVPDLPTALARMGMVIDAANREAFYDTTLAEFATDVRALYDRHASPVSP